MRRVIFTVEPVEGSFHPISRKLVADPSVTPVAVRHAELLADETLVMLGEVQGDPDRYRNILASSEAVQEFVVSDDGTTAVGYSRVIPNSLTKRLFERQQTSDFVVEFPIKYTDDGRQRYTVVGPETQFTGGIDTLAGVDLTVESVTEYRPDTMDAFADLTERERQVLTTALDCGYYETPRNATQKDVAARLDISPSAVGKQLRRIESKVFATFQG